MADSKDFHQLVQDVIDIAARAINVVEESLNSSIQAQDLKKLHQELGQTMDYATTVRACLEDMLSETENEGLFQEYAALQSS
jgi:hypothetical protein